MKIALTNILLVLSFLMVTAQDQDTAILKNEFHPSVEINVFPFILETQEIKIENRQVFSQPKTSYFFLLIGFSILLVAIWNFRKVYSSSLFQSIPNYNRSVQFSRLERSIDKIFGLVYVLISIFLVAFFVTFFLSEFLGLIIPWSLIFVVSFGLTVIQLFTSYLWEYMNNTSGRFQIAKYNYVAYSFLLSILLTPLLLILMFVNDSIQVYIAMIIFLVLVCFFLALELRIFFTYFNSKRALNILQFFLYICTFKILPVLVLVRFLNIT